MSLRALAYVLKSFPEPSETFIAEEVHSVLASGVRILIFHVYDGTKNVVHPIAKRVLDQAVLIELGKASKLDMTVALGRLVMRSPARALRTLIKALPRPDRWLYFQALPASVRCIDADIEFLHAHYADINFLYATKMSEWSGIPCGVTTHRYDILDDPVNRADAREALHQAALVVTISDYNRRHMVEKYGLNSAAIKIVHCGIDLERFSYIEKVVLRDGAAIRLLNVGRLVKIKAQDVLLRALVLVKRGGQPVSLDIVGGGELHDELLQLAQSLDVADVVRFHGAQPEEVVKEMLSKADLFVLPSRSEGLPVACIEALATGTPVVATRIFGIPELIDHQVSGLLVPVEDHVALADAILWAARHAPELEQMRINGRRVVEAGFERRACTQELLQLWRAAV